VLTVKRSKRTLGLSNGGQAGHTSDLARVLGSFIGLHGMVHSGEYWACEVTEGYSTRPPAPVHHHHHYHGNLCIYTPDISKESVDSKANNTSPPTNPIHRREDEGFTASVTGGGEEIPGVKPGNTSR
jgi:hypothetical protein